MTKHNCYIVAEIPEPARSKIQTIRDSLKTQAAKLPVEITLAGSSGVGPIPIGTGLSLIEHKLARVLSAVPPFSVRFSAIRRFPNTATFYLEPFDRSPFDSIHQALRISGIPFSEIPWPYNPHCTLRAGEILSSEAADELLARSFPVEEFWINTVSIYHLDDTGWDCKLLWQRRLGA